MNTEATKRLKSAKGSHTAAVATVTRAIVRADAHAEWLRSPEMADFATAADRIAASNKVADLTQALAELVLDAPESTFGAAQVAWARRTLA